MSDKSLKSTTSSTAACNCLPICEGDVICPCSLLNPEELSSSSSSSSSSSTDECIKPEICEKVEDFNIKPDNLVKVTEEKIVSEKNVCEVFQCQAKYSVGTQYSEIKNKSYVDASSSDKILSDVRRYQTPRASVGNDDSVDCCRSSSPRECCASILKPSKSNTSRQEPSKSSVTFYDVSNRGDTTRSNRISSLQQTYENSICRVQHQCLTSANSDCSQKCLPPEPPKCLCRKPSFSDQSFIRRLLMDPLNTELGLELGGDRKHEMIWAKKSPRNIDELTRFSTEQDESYNPRDSYKVQGSFKNEDISLRDQDNTPGGDKDNIEKPVEIYFIKGKLYEKAPTMLSPSAGTCCQGPPRPYEVSCPVQQCTPQIQPCAAPVQEIQHVSTLTVAVPSPPPPPPCPPVYQPPPCQKKKKKKRCCGCYRNAENENEGLSCICSSAARHNRHGEFVDCCSNTSRRRSVSFSHSVCEGGRPPTCCGHVSQPLFVPDDGVHCISSGGTPCSRSLSNQPPLNMTSFRDQYSTPRPPPPQPTRPQSPIPSQAQNSSPFRSPTSSQVEPPANIRPYSEVPSPRRPPETKIRVISYDQEGEKDCSCPRPIDDSPSVVETPFVKKQVSILESQPNATQSLSDRHLIAEDELDQLEEEERQEMLLSLCEWQCKRRKSLMKTKFSRNP